MKLYLRSILVLLIAFAVMGFQPVAAQRPTEEGKTTMTDFLKSLEGRWSGRATTFTGPETRFEDPWTVSFRLLQGGHFALQEHSIQVDGADHQGWALLGQTADQGDFTMTLADSFHTAGTGLLVSKGKLDPTGKLSVLGHYQAGTEQWGWKTQMQVSADTLVIAVFNISPDGQEYPAIDARLTRQP